jgi:predicted RNase H-like nuclease
MTRVLGVDACKNGWVGISSDPEPRGYFATTIAEIADLADADGEVQVIAIDIPIGLPLDGVRQADVLARAAVGRLSSSVFPTPVRDALAALTHAEAVVISNERTGKGLSVQSYGLRTRILEVDDYVRRTPRAVIEVHPEVSFATLAGRPLTSRKSTWAGIEERRSLLAGAGIQVPARLGEAGDKAAVDDVLDAAVAAWSALRYAEGVAAALPAPPEVFDDGPAAAIWA